MTKAVQVPWEVGAKSGTEDWEEAAVAHVP